MNVANLNSLSPSYLLRCLYALTVLVGVIGLLLGTGPAHAQSSPILQADNAAGDSTMISFDDGGFVAFGEIGTGTISTTGAGTRFMWYPGKAALRAGYAAGTNWDDINVGQSSVALGYNGVASGHSSYALGSGAVASGDGGMALGLSAQASGYGSTAIGISATASGESCVAIGPDALADGTPSCIAIGKDARSSGSYSVALGWKAESTTYGGVAIGYKASTGGVSQGGIILNADYTASGDGPVLVGTGQFAARGSHFWFGENNSITYNTGRLIETSTGAYLTDGGAWTNASDSTKKTDYRAVDGDALLETLSQVPVRTWTYKTEGDDVRHMGPTAQDFHAAFGLGDSETAISTVDADGVNLAAIQALERRTRALQEQNEALEARVTSLEASLQNTDAAIAGLGQTGLLGLLIGTAFIGGLLVWRRPRA